MLGNSGCRKSLEIRGPFGDFVRHYEEQGGLDGQREGGKHLASEPVYNLVFVDAPLSVVALAFGAECGITLAYGEDDAKRVITLTLRNSSLAECLLGLSRALGTSISKVGGVYYLGEVQLEDRAYLVGRLFRTDGISDTKEFLSLHLSTTGTVWVAADGAYVVRDNLQAISVLGDVISQFELLETDVWVVQCYLWRVLEDQRRAAQIEIQPGFELSARLAEGVPSLVSSLGLIGTGKVFGRALREYKGAEILAEPLLLIRDGESGRFRSGSRVPFLRSAVGDSGVVETVGVEFVETGLTMSTSVRGMGAGRVRFEMELSRQDVIGDIQGLPITTDDSFSVSTVLQSGGVYLLGQLLTSERSKSSSLGVGSGRGSKVTHDYIWATVYRLKR